MDLEVVCEDRGVLKKVRRDVTEEVHEEMEFDDEHVGLTKKNEDYNMELLGIGERPGNSWASGCPEAGGPGYSFLI
jgi:hypothetical protein